MQENKIRSGLTPDQQQIVNHVQGNILVSASAGSGKTHTLISRVIKLIVDEGVSVSEILAVTFTEAAAREMREKLKDALSSKLFELKGEEDSLAFNRLKTQLYELPTADISTLHAFCGRLIRSYFFAVGVSPDFKILDEGEAAALRNECINKAFRHFYELGEDWFFELVDRHARSRSDNNLKELVLSAYAFADSEAYPERLYRRHSLFYSEEGFNELLSAYKKSYVQNAERILVRASKVAEAIQIESLEKGTEFAFSLVNAIKKAVEMDDLYAFKAEFSDFKIKLNFERKLSGKQEVLKELIVSLRKEFESLNKRFIRIIGKTRQDDFALAEKALEHTDNFVKIIEKFKEIYSETKREENVLDFNDLEHFALKILKEQEIRESVRKKYKFVFVDEYQDTNGVQDEIVSIIENDNLLMVGDVKQSIYGFRGCRSEFFSKKDSMMSVRGEKVVRLNYNFRSSKAVLEAVNTIFNYCMNEQIYGENYAGRSELIFGGLYPDGAEGRAELHLLHKEKKEQRAEEEPKIYNPLLASVEREESDVSDTAALVRKIIDEELKKEYYDVKEKRFKPITYGDIAVLTRAKNAKYVKELVAELSAKHGIPITSASDENVLDFTEIKLLVYALKAVDCFKWDLPLVAVLKSHIGGFVEEELFEIVSFYRDEVGKNDDAFSDAYEYYLNNANTPLRDRLESFNAYFNKLRSLADFIGANGVLKKLVSDKNLRAHFVACGDGEQKIKRLNRFISASIVNGKVLTVKEFLKRIESSPEAFGIARAGGDSVRAMTIHASKGLEFPVVIVCGLERGFNDSEENEEILHDRNYGFAVKSYDDQNREFNETLLRGVIRESMQEERVKEEMRLFYVAVTRAKYSLHLVCSAKSDLRSDVFYGADSFMDFIPQSMEAKVYTKWDVEFEKLEKEKRIVLIGKPNLSVVNKMKENFSFVYPHLCDTTLPLKNTVTAVAERNKMDEVLTHLLFEDECTDRERGNVAHKVMEHFDFNAREGIKEQAENLVKNGIITKEELSKINLERLGGALTDGVLEKIKGRKLYREKSFLVQIEAKQIFDIESDEGVLLQGVIDLLVVDGKEASVFDYKYSSLDKQSLSKAYAKQLDLYAYAVEKVLNLKVKSKTLINLFTGEVVDIP